MTLFSARAKFVGKEALKEGGEELVEAAGKQLLKMEGKEALQEAATKELEKEALKALFKKAAIEKLEKSAKSLAKETKEKLIKVTEGFVEKYFDKWLSWNRSLAVAAEGGGRVQAQYMMKDTAKNAVKKEVAGEATEDVAKIATKIKESSISEKTVINSAGQNMTRKYVKNQDELLQKAEEAAGGNLDNFKEIKPGWYQNKEGTIKIEWNLDGHANTNEGPHVTVRIKNDRGGWSVVEKYFIEGKDYYY